MTMRTFYFLLITLLAVPAMANSPFDGNWKINLPETDKVAVKFEEGSGVSGNNFKPRISILGLPLPGSYRQGPMSALAANDPKVLVCSSMNMTRSDKRMALLYDDQSKEMLVKGDYRGRYTKFSKKKIQQTYKTPERKVTKTWTLRSDGRLLVSVKIKPRGDKTRTYNRVFDRAPADTSNESQDAEQAQTVTEQSS